MDVGLEDVPFETGVAHLPLDLRIVVADARVERALADGRDYGDFLEARQVFLDDLEPVAGEDQSRAQRGHEDRQRHDRQSLHAYLPAVTADRLIAFRVELT